MNRCAPCPPSHGAARRKASQQGVSLVEILVTVLILSVGVLGLAGMQLRALRGSHSSVQRTQAVVLGQSLLELMRVDRQAALQGDYNLPTGPGASPLCTLPAASAVSPASLAKTETRAWFAEVKSQLGRANDATTCVRVACDTLGLCSVQMQWDDSASGGLPDQSLSLSTRL
jgi:type IV pilus assembly protein PilV